MAGSCLISELRREFHAQMLQALTPSLKPMGAVEEYLAMFKSWVDSPGEFAWTPEINDWTLEFEERTGAAIRIELKVRPGTWIDFITNCPRPPRNNIRIDPITHIIENSGDDRPIYGERVSVRYRNSRRTLCVTIRPRVVPCPPKQRKPEIMLFSNSMDIFCGYKCEAPVNHDIKHCL